MSDVGKGFQAGLGGCFGALAAVVALVVALPVIVGVFKGLSDSDPRARDLTSATTTTALSETPAPLHGVWEVAPPSGTRAVDLVARPQVRASEQASLHVLCFEGEITGVVLGGLAVSPLRERAMETDLFVDGRARRALVVGAGRSTEWIVRFAEHDAENQIGRRLLRAREIVWIGDQDSGLGRTIWTMAAATDAARNAIDHTCGASG